MAARKWYSQVLVVAVVVISAGAALSIPSIRGWHIWGPLARRQAPVATKPAPAATRKLTDELDKLTRKEYAPALVDLSSTTGVRHLRIELDRKGKPKR